MNALINFVSLGILIIIGYSIYFILCKILRLVKSINQTLIRIEASLKPIGEATTVEFYTEIDGQLIKVDEMNLKVTQQVKLNVSFKDDKGNLAPVEGVPVWSATAPALVELLPAGDGKSCVVKPVGPVGDLQVQVNADADLGEGVKDIMGFMDLTLLAGEASVVELSAEEPTDQ